MLNPSAAIFVNAVMIYTSAVLLSYTLGVDNKHQGRILWLGGLVGILVGVSFIWLGSGLEALKDTIPISITTGLMMSQLYHMVQCVLEG